ncbi:hypothetical protein ACFQX6_16125 [Streptosporangium lutulentum]
MEHGLGSRQWPGYDADAPQRAVESASTAAPNPAATRARIVWMLRPSAPIRGTTSAWWHRAMISS